MSDLEVISRMVWICLDCMAMVWELSVKHLEMSKHL